MNLDLTTLMENLARMTGDLMVQNTTCSSAVVCLTKLLLPKTDKTSGQGGKKKKDDFYFRQNVVLVTSDWSTLGSKYIHITDSLICFL